ncbi:MAG: cation:proton antiporter [Bacillota bacterium]|nr:cation:proton antiporter [Bacillota bacterium]
MITSLALIFLVGLSMAAICKKIYLPRIIGMMVTGLVLDPYVLDLFDPSILGISSELRSIALIIILIKAGLSLDLKDLKQVGRPAILMSFVPASFELLAFIAFGPMLLPITRLEAAIMGAVLGAVSPAVVVPRMVELLEERRGTDKSIPQMIIACSSLDDVYVIVLFTAFCNMAKGGGVNLLTFADVPISIVLGIVLGSLSGILMGRFFELVHKKGGSIRNSYKTILVLGAAFLMMAIEGWVESFVSVSGLLAVMSMACAMKMSCDSSVGKDLAGKFGKLWMAAEVLLFVLVGAAVDIRYTMEAGIMAILAILIALAFRSLGVFLCMIGTKLNKKEKLYCILCHIPKATVQAAIGSVPLSMGLPCGNMVLSVAVLSIIITAPIGAWAMDIGKSRLLTRER